MLCSYSLISQSTDCCVTAQLNSTTAVPDVTSVEVLPASLITTDYGSRPSWRPKVHGESSATGFEDTTTSGDNSRVRLEASVTDWIVTQSTITGGYKYTGSVTMIDIGTVIQGIITSWAAMPTVHFEDSASGWKEETTSTVRFEKSTEPWATPSSAIVHFGSSAEGWNNPDHQGSPTSQASIYQPVEVSDDPWTKNLQTPQTTVSQRPDVEQPHVTTTPSKTITDYSPPPAITHDGITAQPIVVTRRPTVTLPNGVSTTTEKVEFQVAIGSSTLSIGAPITINDVVIGITTNAAGSTVFTAGDVTTTLPKPTGGEVRTIAVTTPQPLDIVTTTISGTTKYVLAGQTLAPGKPVTVGDTPISITTSDGKTVLYVGDKTTTLAPEQSDIQTVTDWASVSAGTQGMAANSGSSAPIPTSKKSGAAQPKAVDAALACFGVGMAVFWIIT